MESLFNALDSFCNVQRALLTDSSHKNGITHLQAQILLMLDQRENLCTISSIASNLIVAPATISRSMKSLVSKQLVNQLVNHNDKRIKFWVLNNQGAQLVPLLKVYQHTLFKYLHVIPEADKEVLVTYLGGMAEEIKESFTLTRIVDEL